ncbi:MAG: LapA family protein [Desulfovibrionales bacterium]|nr:LapA family protein [Desulfovibrionales bacterium]
MRYLKVLGLVALFFFSMLFFIQNNATLTQDLALELKVFGWLYQTEAVPFYLLILLSFVLGSLMCTLYFFLERIRLSKQCKQYKKEIHTLEQELSAQRPKSFEETYAAPESVDNAQN